MAEKISKCTEDFLLSAADYKHGRRKAGINPVMSDWKGRK